VKPPPFEYQAPGSVDEAVELLANGDGVRVLAGGQSLVQLMKFRRERPTQLVDINGIPGLDAVERVDGQLRLGALVRQQTLLEDSLVAETAPLLREAAGFVGYKETRQRGTLGGSLAFAAPWAELTAAVVALDGAIEVRSRRGSRTIGAREFFRGPNRTALERDELIVSVTVPIAVPGTGAAFHEVSARYRDYARAAAAAIVAPDRADLVLLCVADAPYRVDARAALRDEAALVQLLAAIDPPDDVEASAAYRRRVAPVLARRALRDASERARIGAPA
jgi:carbon-monoxide dehydrogenase medium subunit